MAHKRKAKAAAAEQPAPPLDSAEQALGVRIATNAVELEQVRTEIDRLRSEQDAALRDGTGGREKAKGLIADILAAERTVELLERERALLADEQLTLRAAQEVAVLRAGEEEIAEAVRMLAAAAEEVDRRFRALGESLANYAAVRDEFFTATAGIAPQPDAVGYLDREFWAERAGEVLAGLLFQIRGKPTPGLRRGAERFNGPVANPEAIIRGVGQHLRRPDVLANLYPDEPALVERMLRLLQKRGDGDAQA